MQNNKKINIKNIFCFLNKLLPSVFWILLIFGFDSLYMGLITVICALLHEIGHIAAIYIITSDFSLKTAFSGLRLRSKKHLSYKEELLIAAAGPLMNLTLFLFSLIDDSLCVFRILNLLTAISNLLPIESYDGYRILENTFYIISNHGTPQKILKTISFTLIIVFCFIALYIMAKLDSGYWIFFIFITAMVKRLTKNNSVFFARKREKKRDFKRF